MEIKTTFKISNCELQIFWMWDLGYGMWDFRLKISLPQAADELGAACTVYCLPLLVLSGVEG
jgi:hypothetical protein